MRSNAKANALILLGSSALLGGAIAFQYLGGLAPCEMCMWQRWPHVAALFLGLIALILHSNRLVLGLAIMAVFVTAGLGFYHVGVEQHLWQGITTCAASPASGSTAEVMAQILATPMVRCDAIAWSLFGISMAGWNALISTAIGVTSLWLVLKRR
jgi:disulfide bond formation protein DsbB